MLVDTNTLAEYRHSMSLLQHQFEQHAVERPDAIAVRWLGVSLTYGELNRLANQIAHALIEQGCQPGSLVLLATERSHYAIAAMLGILKAGAAYVPLDPNYPEQWRQQIIAQCLPDVILGDDLGLAQATVPRLNPADSSLQSYPDYNPELDIPPDSMMYVMFTSGTTGHPKGVMVSHANVARLFPALHEHLTFGPDDTWTLFHSYAFGFSVWEIWGALCHGATLVIVPPSLMTRPVQLLELLEKEHISVLSLTPSAFRGLSRIVCNETQLPDLSALRLIAFSGEPIESYVLERWFSRMGDKQPALVNMYAATETSGEITFRHLKASDSSDPGTTSVGYALPDTALYVLDTWLQPLPPGDTGELYVGGPAVALGYWQDESLTDSRFPDCPGELGDGRLFRTGDLAKLNPDGSINLVGRTDHQVKVNGYRIDTQGVTAQMLVLPGIDDAVVVVEQTAGGDARLAGYYMSSGLGNISHDSLRNELAKQLPKYAVPTKFVEVQEFPLTQNGKLDLAALNALAAQKQPCNASGESVNTESVVCGIWQDLLTIEHPPRLEDDFFELGGDSLRTLGLVLQIEEKLGVHISIADVFEHPRLGDLVARIEKGTVDSTDKIPDQHAHHLVFMRIAIEKAREAMSAGQPPYASCVVKDGRVLACVHNKIWQTPDATGHAEVEAIRKACLTLGQVDLSGCTIYSTCEPCCMCSGAIHWANIDKIICAARMDDEKRFGLSDPTISCRSMIEQLGRQVEVISDIGRDEMLLVLEDWLKIQSVHI